MKKYIAVGVSLLCLSTSLINFTVSAKEESNAEKLMNLYEESVSDKNEVLDEEKIEIEYKLNGIYNKILSDMLVDEEKNNPVYVSNYGGAYIDNNKLIVCLTDTAGVFDYGENVEYITVNYSYNTLLSIQNEIAGKYTELYNLYDEDTEEENIITSIVGMGIDDEKNLLVIDVYNLNEIKMKKFFELFGEYDCVELNNVDSMPQTNATHHPGRGIYVIQDISSSGSITYSICSMGYRAYRNSSGSLKYGFASCGHAIGTSLDHKVYSNTTFSESVVIGNVITSINGGTCDASFIELKSGNSIASTVQYNANGGNTNTDTIAANNYLNNVAVGSTVCKCGITTFKTTATVKSNNYTWFCDGTQYSNVTKTTDFCDSGDSGGIVYMYYNSQNLPVGLVQGESPGYYSYYIKTTEVINNLNVYPY